MSLRKTTNLPWMASSGESLIVQVVIDLPSRYLEDFNNSINSRLHPDQADSFKNCSLVKELDDSAQGTGFAFIVMADVFTKIPGAPFWSALFFMMLLSLGLGSQIGILEGVVSTLFDQPR